MNYLTLFGPLLLIQPSDWLHVERIVRDWRQTWPRSPRRYVKHAHLIHLIQSRYLWNVKHSGSERTQPISEEWYVKHAHAHLIPWNVKHSGPEIPAYKWSTCKRGPTKSRVNVKQDGSDKQWRDNITDSVSDQASLLLGSIVRYFIPTSCYWFSFHFSFLSHMLVSVFLYIIYWINRMTADLLRRPRVHIDHWSFIDIKNIGRLF